MNDGVVESMIAKLREARELFFRLVLLVGPSGSGKTECLQETATREGFPLLSLSLDLSRALLPMTDLQRAVQTSGIIQDVLHDTDSDVVLVDNPELVFSPALKQDPLRLLESLSRSRTLAVAWPGQVDGACVTYAEPEHPEHRRYAIKDFLVVDAQAEETYPEE
jgi:hypothetical protein